MTDFPITPPSELVEQWTAEAMKGWRTNGIYERDIAIQAAQWAADQELEACVEWLDRNSPVIGGFHLRIDRRPKPPSLKKSALHELADVYDRDKIDDSTYDTIRRALEALDD